MTGTGLEPTTALLSCIVSTYWYGIFDCILFSCHVRVSDWIHTPIPECQGTPCLKQTQNLKFKWLQLDLNLQATIECGFTVKRVRDMIRTYLYTIFHTQLTTWLWGRVQLQSLKFQIWRLLPVRSSLATIEFKLFPDENWLSVVFHNFLDFEILNF